MHSMTSRRSATSNSSSIRQPSLIDFGKLASPKLGPNATSASMRASPRHISWIESSAVDPKVATLQDWAWALGPELMLTPRAALNAVDALVRETTTEDDRRLLRDIAKRMHDAATTLQAKAGGLNERVADAADDLSKLDPSEAPAWVRNDALAAALAVSPQ